jgi:hypothetical protein
VNPAPHQEGGEEVEHRGFDLEKFVKEVWLVAGNGLVWSSGDGLVGIDTGVSYFLPDFCLLH